MSSSSPPPALPPPSAFLHIPSAVTYSATPSIIHLKRDLLLPVSLQDAPTHRDGRAAATNSAAVLNTRFGDFPHASLLAQPYGAQVRATNLGHSNRKRKRRGEDGAAAAGDEEHNASGFLHVLAPTAELWTASLPHRTQVVYTPDSSFVLHKLGVRPGSVLIEAGAGSGSFTHAGVRAVYRGYPDGREGPGGAGDVDAETKRRGREGDGAGRKGKVWSFEFHRERVGKLRDEIGRHGLDGLVEVVHRDVCRDGFLVAGDEETEEEFISPEATAIFLDLPAPWLALPHLTRKARPNPSLPTSSGLTPTPSPAALSETPPAATTAPSQDSLPSALSQTEAVRICTFSPCIEQVTRTVSVLRKLGWVEIEMHEIQHRRVEVRRSNRRGYEDGAGPRSVAEAVQRLKWVGEYRNTKKEKDAMQAELAQEEEEEEGEQRWKGKRERKSASAGTPVTRIEPEVKSHTSYLVFAVLPREWAAEEEARVARFVKATTKGVVNAPVVGEGEKWKWAGVAEKGDGRISKRQLKRQERDARKALEGSEVPEGSERSEGAKEEGEKVEQGGAKEGSAGEDQAAPGEEGDKMEVDA